MEDLQQSSMIFYFAPIHFLQIKASAHILRTAPIRQPGHHHPAVRIFTMPLDHAIRPKENTIQRSTTTRANPKLQSTTPSPD